MKKDVTLLRDHMGGLAAYFEQMAGQGWVLTDYQLDTALFEQEEPVECHYAVATRDQLAPPSHVLSVCQHMDKVCDNRGRRVSVYRGTQEQARQVEEMVGGISRVKQLFSVLNRHLWMILIFILLFYGLAYVVVTGVWSYPYPIQIPLNQVLYPWVLAILAVSVAKAASDPSLYMRPIHRAETRWVVDEKKIERYQNIQRARVCLLWAVFVGIIILTLVMLFAKVGQITANEPGPLPPQFVTLEDFAQVEPGAYGQEDAKIDWMKFESNTVCMYKTYQKYHKTTPDMEWNASVDVETTYSSKDPYKKKLYRHYREGMEGYPELQELPAAGGILQGVYVIRDNRLVAVVQTDRSVTKLELNVGQGIRVDGLQDVVKFIQIIEEKALANAAVTK